MKVVFKVKRSISPRIKICGLSYFIFKLISVNVFEVLRLLSLQYNVKIIVWLDVFSSTADIRWLS